MNTALQSTWRGLSVGLLLGTFLPLAPTGLQASIRSHATGTSGGQDTAPQAAMLDTPPAEPDDGDAMALQMLSQAEGMLRIGRPEAAADLARQLPDSGPHAMAATRVRAWALFGAKQHRQLIALLDGLDSLRGELHFLRGTARLRAGNARAGRRELRQLWWNEPDGIWGLSSLRELAAGDSTYSRTERAAIKRIVPAATSMSSTLGSGQRVLDALGDAVSAKTRLGVEIHRAMGIRLLGQEEFTLAVEKLTIALRNTHDAQLRRAIQLSLGDAERYRGHIRSATRNYDAVTAGGDDDLSLQALAHAGQMFIEWRRYPEAQHRFGQQLLSNPVGGARQAALWGLGWVALRTGAYMDARRFFQTLHSEAPFGPDAPRALYWAARSLEEQGHSKPARRELAAIVEQFPVDYYGYRSAHRLGDGPWPEPATITSAPSSQVTRIKEMVDAGMYRRARRNVAKLLKDGADRLGPTDLDTLMQATQDAGSKKQAARLAYFKDRRFPDGTRASLGTLARLFPRQLVRLLRRTAKKARVDDALVVGLVRQESAFNARAVSPVGALGLMQLMPETATGLMREHRRKARPTTEQILDPETNTRLGVRYIGRMLRAFSNRSEYALAAYNAGPGAVTRWRQRRGDLPVDIFVEEIPYEETRHYVQRVLAWKRAWEHIQTVRAQSDAKQTELADASPARH